MLIDLFTSVRTKQTSVRVGGVSAQHTAPHTMIDVRIDRERRKEKKTQKRKKTPKMKNQDNFEAATTLIITAQIYFQNNSSRK